jgi:hypothetical protein
MEVAFVVVQFVSQMKGMFAPLLQLFFGVRSMCDLILYPKLEHDQYHKSCIKGECNSCGISKLQFCHLEVDPNNDQFIPRKWFKNVFVGHFNDGGDRHAIQLQSNMTLPSKFVAYIKPKLTKFVVHNFEAKWQDAQFKSSLDNLMKNQIVTVIDFAQNYSFKEQNEIQS